MNDKHRIHDLSPSNSKKESPMPAWLAKLLDHGYRPYVATSRRLLPQLNIAPFGCSLESGTIETYLLDDEEQVPFHEAYLLSNSLSFASPDLKMPNWVMIDCALMQTAIVGFTRDKDAIPEALLSFYRMDDRIDFERLKRIPVSGQIASPAVNRDIPNFVGISLFSLGHQVDGVRHLGLFTKALALEVYKARDTAMFYGISQYDNPGLKIHGKFSPVMEIEQAMVHLHPRKDMTLIYKMQVDYDPAKLEEPMAPLEPTFWMDAHDTEKKREIAAGLAAGKRYQIAPPFAIHEQGKVRLPILELE